MASTSKKVRIKRGGEHCSGSNCTNSRYKFGCEGMPFFGFPKDELRCKRWVINSRRKDLRGLTPDEIRKKGCTLCQDHFEASQFTNADRKRLNWNAIPTLFNVPNPPPKIDLTRPSATSRRARNPDSELSQDSLRMTKNQGSGEMMYFIPMAKVNPSWKPVWTIVDKEKRQPVCVYAVLVPSSKSVEKSQDMAALRYRPSSTEKSLKVEDSPTVLKLSTAASISEVARFRPIKSYWESQHHVKIKDGAAFKDKQAQEMVDMVKSYRTCEHAFLASSVATCTARPEIKTEILTESEASVESAVTTRDSLEPKIKVETQADEETGLDMQVDGETGVEKLGLVLEPAVSNGTREPENDVAGVTVAFDQAQNALLTQTPESEEPVQMPSLQDYEEAKQCNVERSSGQVQLGESAAGSSQKDDRRAMEFTSVAMPAVGMNTSCTGAGSTTIVAGASITQQLAAFPKSSQHRGHSWRPGVDNLVINDLCAPFKCDDCGARFALVKALTMHKKVHLQLSRHSGQECADKTKRDQKESEEIQKSSGETNCSDHSSHLKEQIDDVGPAGDITCHAAGKIENHQEIFGLSDAAVETIIKKTEGSLAVHSANKCVQTRINESDEETDNLRSLVCKVCGTKFFSLSKLLVHRRKRCVVKAFKCRECSASFCARGSLRFHMSVHRGKELTSCAKCGAGFCREKDFHRHMSKIHGVRRMFSCQECGTSVTTHESLKNHMRIHTGEKPFKCEVCEVWFRGKSGLRAHMRLHTGNRPHICQHCGKSFSFLCQLNKHTRIHSDQKPYTCQECKATFSAINSLTVHMRIHTDERSYSCEICQKSFRQSSHLKTHLKTHKREKSFLCQNCGQRFATKYTLELHIKLHGGETLHQYPSCPAAFSQFQSLGSHLNVHAAGTFFCEICQKSFRSLQYFKQHKKIHSGEKALCHACGKTFHKHLLHAHLRFHCRWKDKEKCFKCTECNAAFHAPTNLYRHKRIHTGVKPYSCDFCFKVFNQSNNLKAHRLIHLEKSG